MAGNPENRELTYRYKATDADDETYIETVPTDAGEYVVKATVAETDNYLSGSGTAEF